MKLWFSLTLLGFVAHAAAVDEAYRSITDFSFDAGQTAFALHRAYSFTPGAPGLLGTHWRLNWESRCVRVGADYVIEDMDRSSRFRAAAQFQNVFGDRLVVSSNGSVQRFWGGAGDTQRVDMFDAGGRLVSRSLNRFVRFELRYSANGRLASIAGPAGSSISLQVNAQGYVTRAVASPGQTVDYRYANGELSEVSINGAPPLRYGYDSAGRWIHVENPATGTVDFAYDSKGRLIRTTYADGTQERSEYDDARQIERRTDANGGVTEYAVISANGSLRISDPAGRATQLIRDEAGSLSSVVSSGGAATRLAYDSSARLSSIDRAGSYEYDPTTGAVRSVVLPGGGRQQYSYDSENRLTSITQSGRTIAAMNYNADGSIASSKDAGSPERRFQYYPGGKIRSVSNPLGEITYYEYDRRGNLSAITNPAGGKTTLAYDPQDRLIRQTDPIGQQTAYGYDAAGRLSQIASPGSLTTRYAYDARGRKIAEIAPDGRSTRYDYDAAGRLLKVTYPSGRVEKYVYNSAGDLISFTDARGLTSTFDYDRAGQLSKEHRASGLEITHLYNAQGQQIGVRDSRAGKVDFQLDAAGRIISQTDTIGRTERREYDEFGQLITHTLQPGTSSHISYTTDGKIAGITEPGGLQASYKYDAAGRLIETHKPSGGILGVVYNSLGKPAEFTSAAGKKSKREYDAAGRLIKSTSPAGRSTTFVYNSRGLLAEKQFSDGKRIHVEYDSAGRAIRLDDGAFPILYTYDDESGNRTKAEYPAINRTITYEYNSFGRRTSMAAGDRYKLNYEYSAAGAPTAIIVNGARIGLTYSQKNNLTGIAYPNSIAATIFRDADFQTTAIDYRRNGAARPVAGWTYRYDGLGNITDITDTAAASISMYRYDAAGEIVEERSGAQTIPYSYGPGGNRVSAGATRFEYDSADRMTRAGAEQLSYDDNGNLIRRQGPSGTTTFQYDVENQLVKIVKPDGSAIQYGYGPDGSRIWRDDSHGRTWFVYDGLDLILELNTDLSGKAGYVYGAGIDVPLSMLRGGAAFFYLQDHLGSVAAITDTAGAIVASYTYDAFGNVLAKKGNVENPFTFTAREFDDDSGLYFYRARYYDPHLGRFLTPDPNSSPADTPLDLNPYLYAANNPVRFVDPLGFATMSRATLENWNSSDLKRLMGDLTPELSAEREIAKQILQKRNIIPPDPPLPTPREQALNKLQGLQKQLENAEAPDAADGFPGGERNLQRYQDNLRQAIRTTQDNLRDLPADPPPPGKSARPVTLAVKANPNAGGNTGANAPPNSNYNDPKGGEQAEDFEVGPDGELTGRKVPIGEMPPFQPGPRPAVPNGFMKDNGPPAERLPPRAGAPPENAGAGGAGGGAAAGAGAAEGAAGASWWQSINNLPTTNPKSFGAATAAAAFAYCMYRGGTVASCSAELAVGTAVGYALGPYGTLVVAAAYTAYTYRQKVVAEGEAAAAEKQTLEQQKKNATDPTKLRQRIDTLTSGNSSAAGIDIDALLARKASLEAKYNEMLKNLDKANQPLAESVAKEIDDLARPFNDCPQQCQAIADAGNSLQTYRARVQDDYRDFTGFLNGAVQAPACRSAQDLTSLNQRIGDARSTLTALGRKVDAAKEQHFNLKLAAAKVNGLMQTFNDKQRILSENDSELKNRGEERIDAVTAHDDLSILIPEYQKDASAALRQISAFLTGLPDPLPDGTTADVAQRVNQLRSINDGTFRLNMPPIGDINRVFAQAIKRTDDNIQKWETMQTQMKAKLNGYRALICEKEIPKSNATWVDPNFAEIQRLLDAANKAQTNAKLDDVLARCRAASNCQAGTNDTNNAIDQLDLEKAKSLLLQLETGKCPGTGTLEQNFQSASLMVSRYQNTLDDSFKSCDFDLALVTTTELVAKYPRSKLAQAANAAVAKLTGWKAAKERIQTLVYQARAGSDQAKANVFLDQARELAQIPCLMAMVTPAEKEVAAKPRTNPTTQTTTPTPAPTPIPTSVPRPPAPTNTGSVPRPPDPGPITNTPRRPDPQAPLVLPPIPNNGPTTTDPTNTPQRPDPTKLVLPPIPTDGPRAEAPKPKVESEPPLPKPGQPIPQCEGSFKADPASGYEGETGAFTIQLSPGYTKIVTELTIRSKGPGRVSAKANGGGNFTHGYRFQGLAGPVSATFVAYDNQGRERCEYTISVTSKGPRK